MSTTAMRQQRKRSWPHTGLVVPSPGALCVPTGVGYGALEVIHGLDPGRLNPPGILLGGAFNHRPLEKGFSKKGGLRKATPPSKSQ